MSQVHFERSTGRKKGNRLEIKSNLKKILNWQIKIQKKINSIDLIYLKSY